MPISPSEIAVLIPAYRLPEMVVQAVRLALATSVGEVLVSDDASGLNLSSLLADFIQDERLRFFTQHKNLGLWENHLFLLKQTQKTWIKFLQTDDGFTETDVQNYCSWADPSVALISIEPYYLFTNGTEKKLHSRQNAQVILQGSLSRLMACRGNVAGRPSYCIYNKDMMWLDPSVWKTNISADLVQHWYLGTQGKVILLPLGGVYCGIHEAQEGRQQSYSLLLARLSNSLKAITEKGKDKCGHGFANAYGTVEYLGLTVSALRKWLTSSEQNIPISKILVGFFGQVGRTLVDIQSWRNLLLYARYKYSI